MNRRRLGLEVWIVLGLSLGQSALYALLSLVTKLMHSLSASTAVLNGSRSPSPWLDLSYQLLGIGFALVPVALALYLLSLDDEPVGQRLGLDLTNWRRDLLAGLALAAAVGIPGLGVYALGRQLGLTANLVLAPEHAYWWTPILLVLAALQNAVLEEFVVVGYLMTRLRQFGWSAVAVIATSAMLRASYHLYQGFGQAFGNLLMGIVFGLWFWRTRRLWPLVVAHAVMDLTAFLGCLVVR